MNRPAVLRIGLIVGYLAIVAAVLVGLFRAREYAKEIYGTAEAQADWEQWVNDVERQQQGKASVRRQVPQSSRPPALVLMEDHFVTCTVAALVVSSALYGTIAWFVYGVLNSPGIELSTHDRPVRG